MAATQPVQLRLEELAESILRSHADPYFVQIGAMDGVRFDPLHAIIRGGGWHGLLVEPLPDQFHLLQENYRGVPGLQFANVAVSEESGTRTINRVDPTAIAARLTPDWAVGISSFFTDRNSIGGVLTSPAEYAMLKPHVIREEVQCMTLPRLLTAHGVERIDLLVIDTEGYDYRILRQLDFTRFRPAVIHLEYYLLPPDEQCACFALLLSQSYVIGGTHKDILATTLPTR